MNDASPPPSPAAGELAPGEPNPGGPVPGDPAGSGPVATDAPARPTAGALVARVLLALALGAAVAALGTVTHRTFWHDLPVGLVVALALTASAAVLCRAWAGLATLAAVAVGWLAAIEVLTYTGAGGDVLVVDPGASIPFARASVVWSWGGIVLMGVVAFLPRRWFARR